MARPDINFQGQFGYSFGTIINMFRGKVNQGIENAQNQMQKEQKNLMQIQKPVMKKQQKQAEKVRNMSKTGQQISPMSALKQPYPMDADYTEGILLGEDAGLAASEIRKRSFFGGLE
tara:strand:+ start:328 stop:678 length:351 start_codon:yes stop_codon:yes gene_type:complete